MDQDSLRNKEFKIDIESCMVTSEDGTPATFSDVSLERSFAAEVSGGFVSIDESDYSEHGQNSIITGENGSEGSPENVKVLIDKDVKGIKAADLVASRTRNERRKSTSAKKPPKPPRPPRGYSLDASDQKLIKEIAELAMIKRARIERMKALKKMKSAKGSSVSSSSGSFFAMFFTIIFCLAIVFHGMSCSNSSVLRFHGSPEAAGSVENLIMVSYQRNLIANSANNTISESPKYVDLPLLAPPSFQLVEQISGSDPEKQVARASG